MSNNLTLLGPNKDFETIKNIDDSGVEFWTARELMKLLGYFQWRNFEEVINKGKQSCLTSGQNIENHFVEISKIAPVGSNSYRKIIDFKLDRYACYLIAQNGDSKKSQIALAQTYFAVQTRRLEVFEQMAEDEKRVFIREEVSSQNKSLFSSAKKAGVTKFGVFNDAGYKGLYGIPLSEIEKSKGLKKGELLDRAGTSELAANLFRITQTDEKLKKDRIYGDSQASKTHFMVGGKVRQTIKEIGGTLPEKLLPEKHIKELKKALKS